jgi:hypothetical protein
MRMTQRYSHLQTVNGSSSWRRFYGTVTLTATNPSLKLYIYNASGTAAITFYLDALQLEKKAYPTNWYMAELPEPIQRG